MASDWLTHFLAWADNESPLTVLSIFCVANVAASSVIPIPLSVPLMVAAGVLWGEYVGLAIYLVTCAFGAWITFLLTKLLRGHVMQNLGRHLETWERLDAAIMREGLRICLLWRVAPLAPFVVSSALISLTAISQFDYVWTTSLGIIPSSVPVVSGAALGRTLATHEELGTLSLAVNVISIGAGVYVMVRLSLIATTALRARGVSPPPSPLLQKTYYTRDASSVPGFSLENGRAQVGAGRRAGTELM
jgi:uncharacterized membrane protein YdjX (TVP38/TMEM64 family)